MAILLANSGDGLVGGVSSLSDGLVGGVSRMGGRASHHYSLSKLPYLGDCGVN